MTVHGISTHGVDRGASTDVVQGYRRWTDSGRRADFKRARVGLLIGPSPAALEITDAYSVDREALVLTIVCDSGR